MISHLAMKNFKGGLGWLVLVILLGCNPENDLKIPSYREYFPLRVGDFKIYQVAETRITLNVPEDFEYQIKIIVTDSFNNAEGDYSYVLTRLKRNSENEDWTSLDTWIARLSEQELVVSEQNIPYVKLSFPVIGGKEWNSNKYNNEHTGINCPGIFNTCSPYKYSDEITTYQSSTGIVLDKAIEVVESDISDPIQIDIRKSKYAYNVGLVFKEINRQEFCGVGCNGQFVNAGLIQIMELIEHGSE